MQTLISKILAQLMDSAGVTQAQLSRATKVGQPTISRILKPGGPKGIQEPTDKQVRPIAEFFGVSSDQLRGHKPLPDALARPKKQEKTESNIEPGPDMKGRVPLISWVQAGNWCEVVDLYAVGDAEDWLACPTAHGDRTYALRVRGVSMFNPHGDRSFKDGDLIYIDPDRQAENGSCVIAKLDDSQEATFKQLIIEGDDRFLKALNPAWPDPIMKICASASICGVVIGKYEVF